MASGSEYETVSYKPTGENVREIFRRLVRQQVQRQGRGGVGNKLSFIKISRLEGLQVKLPTVKPKDLRWVLGPTQ